MAITAGSTPRMLSIQIAIRANPVQVGDAKSQNPKRVGWAAANRNGLSASLDDLGVVPVNPDPDVTRQSQPRACSVPADHAMRPLIVPMFGASIGLLFILIHKIVQLFT
jgi:hypothetical protein